MDNYEAWFKQLTGLTPYPWQRALGEGGACVDRLLRIPTGFEKTAATVLPWLYHRVHLKRRVELDTWIDAQPRGGVGGGRGE